MSDQPAAVSVLNGEVQVGDKVAVAVGSGSFPDLRIGTVTKLSTTTRYGGDWYEVTVRVEQGGNRKHVRQPDGTYTWKDAEPYERKFDRPTQRIIKLAAA